MDQSELDTLVQTVLKQMGYAAGAAPAYCWGVAKW